MKEIAGTVRRALQNDFGAWVVRHRLQHAGRVGVGVGPERDFGAMKQLNGGGPSDAFPPRRPDSIAAVEPIEIEFPCVRGSGRRPLGIWTVAVETLDHLEQVLRGLVLVGQNVDPQPLVAAGAVVIAPADVGRAPLLPALEDQRADAAEACELGFDLFVNILLRPVEDEPN